MAQPSWKDDKQLKIQELKQYFAIDLYMDIVQRQGSVVNYWQKSLWGDEFVRKVMSRDRFMAIRANLTWLDTTDLSKEEREAKNRQDGFWAITTLFDCLTNKFQIYFLHYEKNCH